MEGHLKKIMLLLCANQQPHLQKLQLEMGERNMTAEITCLQRELDDAGIELYQGGSTDFLNINRKQKGILFLTDDINEIDRLEQQNIPYLIVLHEGNYEAQLPSGAYCVEGLKELEASYLERVYRRKTGIPWDIVTTDRLLIREITVEDVPRLYELYRDKTITRYMEPLFPEIQQEIKYTRQYIENIYHFYGYGMWMITLKDSGVVIGRAGLESKAEREGLELGFMLGTEYQHKGYAYEACSAILQYGREYLEEQIFSAVVHKENAASQRLCEKLGFFVRKKGEYIEYCMK